MRDGSFAKGVDCLGWAYNNGIIDYYLGQLAENLQISCDFIGGFKKKV